MSYTVDTIKEIWSDSLGTHVRVGPDSDGLDLVEIKSFSSQDKEELCCMVISQEEALLLAQAIFDLYKK